MSTPLERLLGHTPNGEMEPFDLAMTQQTIAGLTARGWTDDEIVAHMKWMEHVNPLVDEDTAIRNMRAVRERVEARLATTKS